MSKKKSIAVAIVLLLVLVVGGLLAYFTDTDTKTNTFTLGNNIEISLTETWDSSDGLGIHPGAVVSKKPAVKNDSTTTPAYVFMKVEVPCYATTGTTVNAPLFTFTAKSGWTLINNTPAPNTSTKTITYIYAYGSSTAMTELAKGATTPTLFDSVTLAPTLTHAQKATAPATTDIVITGYGIQTDNLSSTNPATIFALFNS